MNKIELESLKEELKVLKEDIKNRGENCLKEYNISSNLIFELPENRRNEFLAAQGNELNNLHYYHSSSALLYNYLSILDQGHPILMLDDLFETYNLECMLPILNNTDRMANIDAVLYGDMRKVLFIESKFLEPIESVVRNQSVNSPFDSYLEDDRYILEDPMDRIKMITLFEWVKGIKFEYFNIVQIVKHICAIYTDMKLNPKKYQSKEVSIVSLTWNINNSMYPSISTYYKLIDDEIDRIYKELNSILKITFDSIIIFEYIKYDDVINKLIRLDDISSKHKNLMTNKYMINYKL